MKQKKIKEGMKKLKNWLCESDTSDDSEDENNDKQDDWNVIGRREKNLLRKEKAEAKKKVKRDNVTNKAKNIVGVGPIKKTSIQHFQSNNCNFEDAKMNALKEHLKFYLHYDDEELTDLEISATQMCVKDDIIYAAFKNNEDVRELHARTTACKDDRVQLRNFVPPQYFSRYMFLSRRCKEVRESDRGKKTQLRFNNGDMEVLMKD